MPTESEKPNPRTLLHDLESRQEELLRMLSELEDRTQKALAELTPTPAKSAAEPSTAKPMPRAA